MYVQHRSQFSSVGMETGLWAEQPENKEFILHKGNKFLFFTIQTSSEAHQTFHPVGIGDSFLENKQTGV
jgi:hypothetical protein